MEIAMPADIMLLTSLVVAFFATFAIVLLFADLTWDSSEKAEQ
jgi:hypothetical protein